jgi:hypothetical protein
MSCFRFVGVPTSGLQPDLMAEDGARHLPAENILTLVQRAAIKSLRPAKACLHLLPDNGLAIPIFM